MGGDNVGIYSIYDKINSVSAAYSVLFLRLALGNYYLGFYVGLYVSTYITTIGIYYLSKEVLIYFRASTHTVKLFSTLSVILYLYNPSILTDTFKSFLANVSISTSLYILFFLLIMSFYLGVRGSNKFVSTKIAFAGIFLGLSANTYPNNFRIITFGLLMVIFLMICKYIVQDRRLRMNSLFFYFVNIIILGSFAAIMDSYQIIPYIYNIHQTLQNSVIISSHFSNTVFETGAFSSVPIVLRLLNDWSFQYYAPYNLPYFNNYLLIAIGYLWPLLALVIPSLIINRDRRKTFIPILLLLIIGIFWAKGGNPPLGSLYDFLSIHIIILSNFFGTYFITEKLLAILYPALIVLSLSLIFSRHHMEVTDEKENRRGIVKSTHLELNRRILISMRKPYFRTILVFIIIIVLLSSSYPAFTGSVYGQYFNDSIKGISIPNEYAAVNSILSKNTSTVLVLPGQSTYFMTSWGYQGSSQFYSSYFGKSQVIDTQSIGSFGVYSQYNITTLDLYNEFTHLSIPSNKTSPLNLSVNYGQATISGNATLSQSNSTFMVNSSVDQPVEIGLPFNRSTNISSLSYLSISLNVTNQNQLTQLINHSGLLVGLSSPKVTGWYIIGHDYNSFVRAENGTDKIFLMVPDINYGNFSDFNFNELYIKFAWNLSDEGFNLSHMKLNMSYTNSSEVNWPSLDLLKQYSVNYILVDYSIIQGEAEAYNYVASEVKALINNKDIKSVYGGGILNLYQIKKY